MLSCADLAVFKALFGRPRDFVDLSEMALAASVDLDGVADTVAGLVGADAPVVARLRRPLFP